MSVARLKEVFKDHFHCEPEYFVRCPGRVNLIGEHIDYSGYAVLPMAIDSATFILVSPRDDQQIVFRNTDEQYEPYIHRIGDEWVGEKKPQWYHYFLCGWRGMSERMRVPPRGLNVLVSGSIPASSGLSSSSSLVCASALATLATHVSETFESVSRAELAELCARAEHYIGTEGGGMDQAIEILATQGSALLIDFNPLRWTAIKLPDRAMFAVLHCGATLNKAATSQFNQRVVECRIAAQMIAKASGVDEWKEVRTLGQVAAKLDSTPDQMVAVVGELLAQPVYTRQSILTALGITDQQFREMSLSANTQDMEQFNLAQRATHVYSEASRVLEFRDASNKGDLARMGRLMNESHESCRELYECSCEELDRTVRDCRRAGALGARLTGAGWGGCVVALFDQRRPDLDVLFWSQPSDGIQVQRWKLPCSNVVFTCEKLWKSSYIDNRCRLGKWYLIAAYLSLICPSSVVSLRGV